MDNIHLVQFFFEKKTLYSTDGHGCLENKDQLLQRNITWLKLKKMDVVCHA